MINREEPFTLPDGSVRWLLTIKVTWHNAAGQLRGLIGISPDFTAPHETAEAMDHEKELLMVTL